MSPRIGIGWRRPLAEWLLSGPAEVECLELTAEHFFDGGEDLLRELGRRWPVYVHGLGLSLGTPGALDAETLRRFARVAEVAGAEWVSEHVAFTRAGEVDLGHLNPVHPTRLNARLIGEHARQVADACGRPVILENITSHLLLRGELSEPDMLNAVCEAGDCGLLLDVTNLFVNARNHRFDPLRWLDALDVERVVQLHMVGYARCGERLEDRHEDPIQDELYALAREVCTRAQPRAVILERDGRFPHSERLAAELRALRYDLCEQTNAPDPGTVATAV